MEYHRTTSFTDKLKYHQVNIMLKYKYNPLTKGRLFAKVCVMQVCADPITFMKRRHWIGGMYYALCTCLHKVFKYVGLHEYSMWNAFKNPCILSDIHMVHGFLKRYKSTITPYGLHEYVTSHVKKDMLSANTVLRYRPVKFVKYKENNRNNYASWIHILSFRSPISFNDAPF